MREYVLIRPLAVVLSSLFLFGSVQGDRPSFGPLSPSAVPYERQYIWPEGKMPDVRPDQIAAKTDEVKKPAYVLADGATGPNAKKGIGAEIVPELAFDEKTCPMCFLQGADDVY